MAAPKKTAPKAKNPDHLDIFREMAQADKKNVNFFDELRPAEIKSFSPLVAMRWFSSVNDQSDLADYHILVTNELMNIGFWDLSKYPELQWMLMAAGGTGQIQRHQWIPMTKKKSTNKLDQLVLKFNPGFNDFELELYKSKLTKESLKQLLRDMALEDKDMKPIMDDFKKMDNGSST
jgi:hypothetical protein